MAATRTNARAGGALRWWGVALIAVTGVIHLILAPEHGDYAPYLGLLFVANGLGAALAVVGIARQARWGWVIGVLVAGGAAIAYVWSRSVGLPSLPEDDSEWLDPLGLVALLSEGSSPTWSRTSNRLRMRMWRARSPPVRPTSLPGRAWRRALPGTRCSRPMGSRTVG
jgi:hypothetical protein